MSKVVADGTDSAEVVDVDTGADEVEAARVCSVVGTKEFEVLI